MSNYPWDIMALAGILLLNRAALRASWSRPWLFYLIQGLDGGCVVYLIVFGLKGLAHIPAANWIVVALLLFHIAQNVSMRTHARQSGQADARMRNMLREARNLKSPPTEGEP